MNGGTVARTPHFALHRLLFSDACTATPDAAADNAVVLNSDHAPAVSTAPANHPQPLPAAGALHPLFGVNAVWMGAMVPKRWARRAVTRNTIKRQIYAVSAALEGNFCVAAHVVRLRSTFDRKQYLSATSDQLKHDVRSELQQLFAAAVQPNSATMALKKVSH